MLNYRTKQFNIKREIDMKPGNFRIYTDSSAANFYFVPPKLDEWGRIAKNGCVMTEFAQLNKEISNENQRYFQWNAKILFAISLEDLTVLFENKENPNPILHNVPKTTITKKLDIELGEGKFEGTMRLTLHEFDKKNGLHKQITVSFTKGQYLVLLKLLESVIPKMIGWQ